MLRFRAMLLGLLVSLFIVLVVGMRSSEAQKKSGEAKNVEQRINYISQMHNTEFYVLARTDISSLQDLAGERVGFHVKGSGPSVTGPMVVERLGINVEPVYINHTFAIEKMRSGEIAAIFQLGAKPNDLLAKLKPEADCISSLSNGVPSFHTIISLPR